MKNMDDLGTIKYNNNERNNKIHLLMHQTSVREEINVCCDKIKISPLDACDLSARFHHVITLLLY